MRPGLRTKSLKKVKKKLPSGSTTTHFKHKKAKGARCSSCGAEIHGLPILKPIRYSNLNKSARTINRKYGVELCSKCSREKIKKNVRVKNDAE